MTLAFESPHVRTQPLGIDRHRRPVVEGKNKAARPSWQGRLAITGSCGQAWLLPGSQRSSFTGVIVTVFPLFFLGVLVL